MIVGFVTHHTYCDLMISSISSIADFSQLPGRREREREREEEEEEEEEEEG